eukprot:CAMPEP_0197653256 /NCGR_PEP_ID=MMETSP1338-20131121/34944_1 /TAXON_ID=43686 ORGANISM="Pelagodinium beii, Strain RCC1491" /NCGR_SAMPLE_ID=MMETSP1338 /ASSEMBLY_ACC=CAM_ASM_000754 /LENGTH=213 /DNA_ID=CAMNT_0043228297 /DNA_START=245 /DNA_END=886 /DNA_ORIENTATION=+
MTARASHHAILILKAAETSCSRVCASKPRMAHGLICCEAITSPHLQQPEDEVQRTLGNVFPSLLGKAQVSLNDLAVQFVKHIVEKRQGAAEQHISDHANRPNIDFTAILLLLDHLWGQVEVGAANGMRSGQTPREITGHFCEAKIRNLDVCVAHLAAEENVFRLQISVHDASAMDIGDSLEKLAAGKLSLMFRVVLFLLDALVEFTALAKLQN